MESQEATDKYSHAYLTSLIESSVEGYSGQDRADRRYNRSFRGMIRQMYKNMRGRVYKKRRGSHCYGLDLCEPSEFYELAQSSERLRKMWADWVLSGFPRHLSPSVDRIIPERGYLIDNIQFITCSQNSKKYMLIDYRNRRGTTSKYRGVHYDTKRNRWLSSVVRDGVKVYLGSYVTEDEAAAAVHGANEVLSALGYNSVAPDVASKTSNEDD